MRKCLRAVAVFGIVLIVSAGLAAAQTVPKPEATTSDCPCFTRALVETIPQPYTWCTIQNADLMNTPWDLIANVQNTTVHMGAQAEVYPKKVSGECIYLDASDPDVFVQVWYDNLSLEQAMACRQILLEVIAANADQCLELTETYWVKPH